MTVDNSRFLLFLFRTRRIRLSKASAWNGIVIVIVIDTLGWKWFWLVYRIENGYLILLSCPSTFAINTTSIVEM